MMVRWLNELKKRPQLVIILGVIIVGVCWLVISGLTQSETESNLTIATDVMVSSESSNTYETLDNDLSMYVDVKGAVMHPGVYEVTQTMRVANVIELAGGLSDEADDTQVNLAQRVSDQMMIYVPLVGEEVPNDMVSITGEQKDKQNDLVNLNQATKEELMSLSGVGDKKADKIIEYREENGSFQRTEDLMNVDGIGEKTFDSLKTSITI